MGEPSARGKPKPAAILQEGTRVGAYEILSRVGVGGMGEVYRARHTGLNKTVAFKLLSADVKDEDARARFMREGKLASKIQHPHIVDVTDVGEHHGTPFLVMEFLEGQPLSRLLKQRTRLNVMEAVDVMVPVAAAIAAAHAMGVVHRDIKPDNIFLTESALGEVVPKVLDFGISKAVEDHTAPAITMTHAFVGTPHYMSPEQAQGAKRATKLSDQYSLGVVLYEVLSGVRPFDEPSFLKLVHSIARGRAVPLRHVRPDIDPAIEGIVGRSMHPEASHRFPSVREMALALLPYASQRTQAVWQQRLETLSGPNSHFRSVASGAGGLSQNTPSARNNLLSQPGLRSVDTFRDAPQSRRTPSMGSADTALSAGTSRSTTTRTISKRKQSWLVVAALALLAAGGLTAAYVLAPPKGESAETKGADPAAATFRVSVEVKPHSAVLVLDGEEVGTGSFVGELPRDGKLHRLEVKAEGYQTQVLGFKDAPPQEKVALDPVADKPAVEPSAAPSTTAATPAAQAGRWPKPTAAPEPEPTAAPTATATPGPTSTSTTGNIDPWQNN